MKNVKKLPTKKLERFSNIFTQLGLVLVLFIVYVILEHQTLEKSLAILNFNTPEAIMISPDQDILFVREPKPESKIQNIASTVFTVDEPVKKVDNNIVETVLVQPIEDIVQLDIDTLITVEEPK